MPEDISVNVVLTKEDIKRYYFAVRKRNILLSSIICILMIVGIALSFDIGVMFNIIAAAVLLLALGLSIISRYKTAMNEFQNKRSDEKTYHFLFSREGYHIDMYSGYATRSWNDMTKIIEYKTAFAIVLTIGKAHLLPKRCFAGPEQLQAFYTFIEAGVDRPRLKIKKYPFSSFSPGTPEPVQNAEPPKTAKDRAPTAEGGAGTPLFRYTVLLRKKELISLNFWYYYTKPIGIVATILGFVMLIMIVVYSSLDLDINLLLLIILCAYFLAFMPALMYFRSSKAFRQDATAKNEKTYAFYADRIEAVSDKSMQTKSIGELRRIVERRNVYLFFATKNLAFILPKRCIGDNAAFEDYFRHIKAENLRQNTEARCLR